MYFKTNISVTIAGKALQTVVSVKAKKDGHKIGAYCDIVCPLNARIQYSNPQEGVVYLNDIVTNQFKSGDPVSITAWYDGFNKVNVFSGYIYDFIEGMPLTIKCMDYSYFLNLGYFGNKRIFLKKKKSDKIVSDGTGVNYKSVTLKQLLQDLIAFVNESIKHYAPGAAAMTLMLPTMDLTLENLTFISMSPMAILEWLKKQVGFNITLFGSQLYVNIASNVVSAVTLSTARNVIRSGLQKQEAAFQRLRLKCWFINENGTKNSFEIGDESGTCIEQFFYKVKRQGDNYEQLAQQALLKHSQHKFNGDIETLLYPECDLFWVANYTDVRYPSKSGSYTIIGTEIDLSQHGFHRRHKLAFTLDLAS